MRIDYLTCPNGGAFDHLFSHRSHPLSQGDSGLTNDKCITYLWAPFLKREFVVQVVITPLYAVWEMKSIRCSDYSVRFFFK